MIMSDLKRRAEEAVRCVSTFVSVLQMEGEAVWFKVNLEFSVPAQVYDYLRIENA